ncbi:MAG: hypothetical protein HY744_26140 [Deltaproteobacteria bacterium]|nr:hypothetical protein [Deltaproteobacteria bacterium]
MEYLPAYALIQVYLTTFVAVIGLFGFLNIVGAVSKASGYPVPFNRGPAGANSARLTRNLAHWATRMLWVLPVCSGGVAATVILAVANFERDTLGDRSRAVLLFFEVGAAGVWRALGASVVGIVVAVLRGRQLCLR